MPHPQIQIGDEVREMTDEEFAQWQADATAAEVAKSEAELREKTRDSALAKLAALGLTDEEIAALLF